MKNGLQEGSKENNWPVVGVVQRDTMAVVETEQKGWVQDIF